MSERNHTRGPWAWMDMGGIVLVGQHGHRPIVLSTARKGMNGATIRLNNDGIMRDFDADHPDARLIAAAPELLDIARDFLTLLAAGEFKQDQALIARVRSVIDKAGGTICAYCGEPGADDVGEVNGLGEHLHYHLDCHRKMMESRLEYRND